MSCSISRKASWGTLNCAGYLTVTRTMCFPRYIFQIVKCSGYPGFVITPKVIPWIYLQTQPSLKPVTFGEVLKQLCNLGAVSCLQAWSPKQVHLKAMSVAWWQGLSIHGLEGLICGYQIHHSMFNGENSLGDQLMVWISVWDRAPP